MLKVISFSLVLILSGCVNTVRSEINLCGQLPSVSVRDTTETILEVDNFNQKYMALYCNAQQP